MFSILFAFAIFGNAIELTANLPPTVIDNKANVALTRGHLSRIFEKLHEAHISGIEIPIVWKKLEPEHAQFRFEGLRKLLSTAEKYGIHVSPIFSISKGEEAPEFLTQSKLSENDLYIEFLTEFKKQLNPFFENQTINEIIVVFEQGKRPRIQTTRIIEEVLAKTRIVFDSIAISSTIPRGLNISEVLQIFRENNIRLSCSIENEQFAEVLADFARQKLVGFTGVYRHPILDDNVFETIKKLVNQGMIKLSLLSLNDHVLFGPVWPQFVEFSNDVAALSAVETSTQSRTSSTVKSDSNADFDNEIYNSLTLYQVMVSSFQNGDNNVGYNEGYGPSDHNGDLRGIINALDYIKGLGVNALWMTPVFDSSGNTRDRKLQSTGYFANDYFNIDPNFGSNEVFRELVNTAHSKGLYVILDGVFGHHGGNIRASPSGRYPEGGQDPVSYPGSLDFYREVATYWINEYEIDGWRLDQCYQVNQNGHNYLREIREAVEAACLARKNSGKQWGILGYVVGEDWNGESAIQKNTYSGGGLRSAFDFPSRYRLVQTLACEESYAGGYGADNIVQVFKSPSDKGYSHELGYIYPNLFITNHDIFRFGNLIRNKYGYGQENGDYWKRYKVAISCLAAYTGPITIYYGDEVGDIVECYPNCGGSVGSDNMARTNGHISGFTSQAQNMHDYTAKVINLRNEHPAMWRGNNNSYTYGSCLVNIKYDQQTGEKIVFIANTGTNSQYVSVNQGNMVDLITGNSYNNDVTVDGLTVGIYRVQ
ncbi:alpha-amylase [Tritrichomonas foetus]|uniref:Alpha-amylase n=1 Tax=Tritrichomonas foetus TaxID=1144522 RepID=A0A1J4J2N9_9EUKA|nr:alpha-amylase [Tritrichomonas foetus]|eukprot:OHS93642.1 alpha-amylase [Tritrichomonas foetus]